MKTILKSAVAGTVLGAALIAAPQVALAAPKAVIAQGIAVANVEAVIGSSSAYQTAQTQRPVTYKATIDAANARKAQIEAQLRPLYAKVEADSKNPKADRAALQQQVVQIRQIEQSGQQELQQMLAPLEVSEQYVLEQIGDKLEAATKAAMANRGITMILDSRGVVQAEAAYNINQDILTELNRQIPSAQLVPPAGWQPRAAREAAAAQAAARPAAPGTAPAPAPAAPVRDDGRGN